MQTSFITDEPPYLYCLRNVLCRSETGYCESGSELVIREAINPASRPILVYYPSNKWSPNICYYNLTEYYSEAVKY